MTDIGLNPKVTGGQAIQFSFNARLQKNAVLLALANIQVLGGERLDKACVGLNDCKLVHIDEEDDKRQ
jgi:hypothetical protein